MKNSGTRKNNVERVLLSSDGNVELLFGSEQEVEISKESIRGTVHARFSETTAERRE